MNKKIVILNGSGGVGKDTFVNYCDIYTKTYNVSTVGKIKEVATMLGWEGGKSEKDRLFLSNLKLLAVEYNDHSYNYVKKRIEYFLNHQDEAKIMFIHVREPEEIARFKQDFGAITVLMTNKNVPQILSNMADGNVEKYTYDYVINNDEGLYELKLKAYDFVSTILRSQDKQLL